jgi:hypothetical protein
MIDYCVKNINYQDVKPFLLHIHYAKRIPSISYSIGLFYKEDLVGCVCYGYPPSTALKVGIAGEQFKKNVIELNRLVLKNNKKNEASYLVGNSFKLLPKNTIIVSYADISQKHIGYVYQATNFIYTGLSAKRTEWQMIGVNKHSFTICETYSLHERKTNKDKFKLIDRPRKHRYLYLIGDKKFKKDVIKNLKYKIKSYPKSYDNC